MDKVTDKNFGIIIAFLLPGSLLLFGLSISLPDLGKWFSDAGTSSGPSVGGFLYATLASLVFGMVTGAIRWFFVDHLLHWTIGPRKPPLNYGKLREKDTLAGFLTINENFYRYYQFYSNSLVATIIVCAVYLEFATERPSIIEWALALSTMFILLMAARDSLTRYYSSANQILST